MEHVMNETERIKDQLERAVKGPAWHGPSLMEIVSEADHSYADTTPMKGVHTIREILLHIIVWIRIGRMQIDGEQGAKELDRLEDWPVVEKKDAEAWRQTVKQLQEEHDLLLKRVSGLTDADLSKNVVGKDYKIYILLHGIVQHNLYHAGQIALIKSSLTKRL